MGSTTHTKEPWSYQIAPCGTEAVVMEEDGTIIMDIAVRENTTAHRRLPHNLARIVAAVKGTEGIDTGLLLGFSPLFLARYPDRVLRERQEAQATIKQLSDAAKAVLGHSNRVLQDGFGPLDNTSSRGALDALREAVLSAAAPGPALAGERIEVDSTNGVTDDSNDRRA